MPQVIPTLGDDDTLSLPIEVVVVGSRAVYLNSHRIAGGKPWNSEGLPHQTFNTTLGDVLAAFTNDQLLAAVAERTKKAKFYTAQRAAASASPASEEGE